jgi:GR25 family glycosyltransferase involved in LPS biosynthesis
MRNHKLELEVLDGYYDELHKEFCELYTSSALDKKNHNACLRIENKLHGLKSITYFLEARHDSYDTYVSARDNFYAAKRKHFSKPNKTNKKKLDAATELAVSAGGITFKFDAVYVVNLNDRPKRWKLFSDLNNKALRRQPAVDTRLDKFAYERYGLTLKPLDRCLEWNFTQSFGAVGCFLSHYEIYQDIIKNDYQNVLCIEDDAHIDDIAVLLDGVNIKHPAHNFIQYNKRTSFEAMHTMMDGTESYYITNSGAQIMLDAVADFSHFRSFPRMLGWETQENKLYDCDMMRMDIDKFIEARDTPNAIRAPIDKFLGYNYDFHLPPEKRLRAELIPFVGLHGTVAVTKTRKKSIQTDVMNAEFDKAHWDMDCEELRALEASDLFRWWEKKNEIS